MAEAATVFVLVAGFELDHYTLESIAEIRNQFQILHPNKEVKFRCVPLDSQDQHLQRCRSADVVGVLMPPPPPIEKAMKKCQKVPHVVLTGDGLMRLEASTPALASFPALVPLLME